jgi:hypothetical protein
MFRSSVSAQTKVLQTLLEQTHEGVVNRILVLIPFTLT